MVALVHPVFDCLMRLAQPDALMNEEEVRSGVIFLFYIHFNSLHAYLEKYFISLEPFLTPLQYIIHGNALKIED